LAFGDIAQDDGEEFLPAGFDLRDRSFDRKLFAIGPQSAHVARAGHSARGDARLPESAYVAHVDGAEVWGDEAVERLAESFGSGAKKHQFGGMIEQQNALFFIHSDDRVHRRIDDAGQSRLAVAQFFIGARFLVHLACHFLKTRQAFLANSGADSNSLAGAAERARANSCYSMPRASEQAEATQSKKDCALIALWRRQSSSPVLDNHLN